MKKSTLIVLPSCLALFACPMGCRPILQDSGSLPPGKTIVPVIDVDAASYDVNGTGPESKTFSAPGVTDLTVVQHSLAAGEWTITVDAYNAGAQHVGTGSLVVTIEPGTKV